MALMRFTLDLAIPKEVYDAIPSAKKLAVRNAIRDLKALAVKINDGTDNEEMTVSATWHICHHDENPRLRCEPEQDI